MSLTSLFLTGVKFAPLAAAPFSEELPEAAEAVSLTTTLSPFSMVMVVLLLTFVLWAAMNWQAGLSDDFDDHDDHADHHDEAHAHA